MKISVVMPVYNTERYVRSALDSVAVQAHRDWECVCVDDGSTDGSGAVLDEYAARDPRFRVMHKPNGGVSSARNAGMDAASGDLIAFLDSDDTFHPRALEIIADAYAKTGADLIRYDWNVVTGPPAGHEPLPASVAVEPVDLHISDLSPMRHARCGGFAVVSRWLAGQLRWPPLPSGEDPLFLLDCFRLARRSVHVRAVLANYLIRAGSASRSHTLEAVEATCTFLAAADSSCRRFDLRAAAVADTRRYFRWMFFKELYGVWRKVPYSCAGKARAAYFKALLGVSGNGGQFAGLERRLLAAAARRRSVFLVFLFGVLPFRLWLSFAKHFLGGRRP